MYRMTYWDEIKMLVATEDKNKEDLESQGFPCY